jgi:hypothetical protein
MEHQLKKVSMKGCALFSTSWLTYLHKAAKLQVVWRASSHSHSHMLHTSPRRVASARRRPRRVRSRPRQGYDRADLGPPLALPLALPGPGPGPGPGPLGVPEELSPSSAVHAPFRALPRARRRHAHRRARLSRRPTPLLGPQPLPTPLRRGGRRACAWARRPPWAPPPPGR